MIKIGDTMVFKSGLVYAKITAPLYWWNQFQTYKVDVCVPYPNAYIELIYAKEFTIDDFSHEGIESGWMGTDVNGVPVVIPGPYEKLESTIALLNSIRETYLQAVDTPKARDIWRQMIMLLPSSYNQTRMVMINCAVLSQIYKIGQIQQGNAVDEWVEFCKWIEDLPCFSQILQRL